MLRILDITKQKAIIWSFLAGYGSSTDERYSLGQIENRLALNSFFVGTGYFGQISEKIKIGLQFVYNHQEYIDAQQYQNEYNLFTSFSFEL